MLIHALTSQFKNSTFQRISLRIVALGCFIFLLGFSGFGQTLGTSGTIQGTVLDPSGAAIKGATVKIQNPVSGYESSLQNDSSGQFRFDIMPFNSYHLSVCAAGFKTAAQDVTVRTSLPVHLKLSLQI